MADTENPASEDNNAREEPKAPRITAGQMLREARLKAGVTVAKVSADLRISPNILEALESGEYSKLAGAPYIRALLVSLSRYLKLDTKDVLQAYGDETGIQPATAVPVSPYKDDSKTHAKAHKQIFILLLAILLFVLLLIMGKVNSSSSEEREPEAPPSSDTLLNIDPAMESDSLSIDSLGMDSAAVDSTLDTTAVKAIKPEARTEATTITPPAAAKAKEEKPAVVKEPAQGREPTAVRLQALSDSVFVRVIRPGRRESSRALAPGEAMNIKHEDVITFITRNSSSVEVTAGGTVVIPDKRQFKVSGTSISY
jgi:cytoskeletal protein RodZ